MKDDAFFFFFSTTATANLAVVSLPFPVFITYAEFGRRETMRGQIGGEKKRKAKRKGPRSGFTKN